MNIIDTNGVDYIISNNLYIRDDYYLAPDIVEEVEMTLLVHGKRIPVPNKVLKINESTEFDEALYLNHYKSILNKYGGRSFYNMTGFGDVSILAVLHMLIDVFKQQKQRQLFQTSINMNVFTNDNRLINKVQKEFYNKNIFIQPINNIF